MLDKIKSTLKSPQFQAQAIKVTGGIANVVITAVVANVVSGLVNKGIEALVEKVNPTVETPAE